MSCRGFRVMPSPERAMEAIEVVAASLASADRVRPNGFLVVVEDKAALRTVLDYAAAKAQRDLAGIETGTAETVKQGSVPKG